MRPVYEHRCATFCVDRYARPRMGDRWVHLHGRTLWVCEPCANSLGREAGIPSSRLRRAPLVLKGQLALDLAPETHSSAGPRTA